MAQVNIGAIKFNWKGPYNNATAYVVDDVVSSGGSSYVCILASTGNAVSNGTYWQIMSSAGTNGQDADLLNIASTAQGDIYYNNGSAIARLAPGVASQVLQTGGTGANPSWGTVSSDVVKILEVSGSNAQVIALDSCFSSTYENYFIQANIHTSATAQVAIRLQNASNTEITSNYFYGGEQVSQSNGAIGGSYKGGWSASSWEPHESTEASTEAFAAFDIWVHKPFLSTFTQMNLLMHTYDGASLRTINSGLQHRAGQSNAGIRFYSASGNCTSNSKIKVYGIK